MFIKQLSTLSVTITTICTTSIFIQSSQAQSNKFTCDISPDNVYTTYARTPDGLKPVMRWESTYFPPPYTPERRCQEVTGRFNRFYSQGILQSLSTGWVNRSPVICVGLNCNKETVLLTLKPNQNPDQALQEIIANRAGASGPTVQCSSCSTVINLDDYLEKTPVERADTSIVNTVNPTPKPAPSNSSPKINPHPANTNPNPNSLY